MGLDRLRTRMESFRLKPSLGKSLKSQNLNCRRRSSNPSISAMLGEKFLFLNASQSWPFGGPYREEPLGRLEDVNLVSLELESNKGNTRTGECPRHVSRDRFIVG
jgi:hypothetical protein